MMLHIIYLVAGVTMLLIGIGLVAGGIQDLLGPEHESSEPLLDISMIGLGTMLVLGVVGAATGTL